MTIIYDDVSDFWTNQKPSELAIHVARILFEQDSAGYFEFMATLIDERLESHCILTPAEAKTLIDAAKNLHGAIGSHILRYGKGGLSEGILRAQSNLADALALLPVPAGEGKTR